jgi:uncharacterized protein YqjF (DUF2071 family)
MSLYNTPDKEEGEFFFQFVPISVKSIRVMYGLVRNGTKTYVKKSTSPGQRQNPRKGVLFNLLVTPAKKVVAHFGLYVTIRFYLGFFRLHKTSKSFERGVLWGIRSWGSGTI